MNATYINVECIRAMHSFGCALCLFVQSRYWSRRRCPRREEERERAKKEREEGARRRIGKEKWEVLYIFDSLDSEEKREKRRRSQRS